MVTRTHADHVRLAKFLTGVGGSAPRDVGAESRYGCRRPDEQEAEPPEAARLPRMGVKAAGGGPAGAERWS